ncbi:MAG: hypothetical protein K2N38_12860 [Oscillospiraceae bacterium]|nr:hypothetical protein [Oscillospiraceae bacterium]
MEFLIGAVLVIIIMLCIGFGWADIAMLGFAVAGAFIVLLGGFFAVCLVFIVLSKRKSGVFTEFSEERRFPCAVYRIDGEDVPNMFPCEMMLRSKLYVRGKEIRLLYCRPIRSAIDGNALATMIFGSVVFIPAAVFAVVKMIEVVSEILKAI